ncbi:MAG: histidinol-phosphatase HisJ family protein [Tyzzerella sp.]|nr:histidinol-phosphatase HisJ family protein [Tyzzerella sp.]
MRADYHMHTSFSYDSDSSPGEMIQAAIQKGLKTICITDHHELDYIEPGWEQNLEQYHNMLRKVQEKYQSQIEILAGIEFGMQLHTGERYAQVARSFSYDFILASVHIFDGYDPYYPGYFDDKTDEEGYRRAFEITLENVRNMSEYDSLGHIDYIVRYGNYKEETYSYSENADYIDEILRHLIQNGKGLEVNTAGWKSGLSFAHPRQDILKRYRELGGEIITIGSDAHSPEHLAYDFHKIKDYLEACGFKYYTEFRQRKPYFCAIY